VIKKRKRKQEIEESDDEERWFGRGSIIVRRPGETTV